MIKFSSLILLLLLITSTLSGQDCERAEAIVTAPSGLILRTAPAKGFVTSIPLGDTVEICLSKSYGQAEYEGIKGDWRKLYYQDKQGFSFDGFLRVIAKNEMPLDSLREASQSILAKSDSILGLPKNEESDYTKDLTKTAHPNLKGDNLQFAVESYNFCGPIESLDPSLYWYGVFLQDENDPSGLHRIKPVDLKLILSKEKVGSGLEFDILTDNEERSLFLLGSDKVIPHQEIELYDPSEAIRMRGSKLFPGQELSIDDENKVKLSATGQVIKAGDCPELKDYKITIRYQSENQIIEQDLADLLTNYGDCQIPRLYWYGDISGDGFTDLIYVSVFEDKNVFTLLQSIAEPKDALFSKKAVFTLSNCK